MTSLHIKGQGFQPGYTLIASPKTSPLQWLTVGRLGLVAGKPHDWNTDEKEAVLDVLSGTVRLEVDGKDYGPIGGRTDPFGNGPTLICLPPGTPHRLTSLTPTADIFVTEAPADKGQPVSVVKPSDVPARAVGAGNWLRHVWPGTSIAPGTQRLMVGETVNPPGNWSSYPPHKHDTDNPPVEAIYEEVYFFLLKPKGGFGIQRIYETRDAADAINDVYVVQDGDAVLLPRGYHPVVAAPGYQLLYAWSLCGTGRSYGAWSDDPAHAWLRHVEPILHSR